MDMNQPHNAWGAIIACLVFLNAIFQYWSSRQIKKIEVATNSMKDALVAATRAEALLVGANAERDRAALENVGASAGIAAGTAAAVTTAVTAAVSAAKDKEKDKKNENSTTNN